MNGFIWGVSAIERILQRLIFFVERYIYGPLKVLVAVECDENSGFSEARRVDYY